jgi:hypothetical protein
MHLSQHDYQVESDHANRQSKRHEVVDLNFNIPKHAD